MGKKPIVSVTYESERISIKNSLPYLKCDTKHKFCYLDFRCQFEADGQNHIHFLLIQVLKNSMTMTFSHSHITF